MHKYYGKGRNDNIEQYLDKNVVFTTYHTVSADMNTPNSAVFKVHWFRIVLDEGERCICPTSLRIGGSATHVSSRESFFADLWAAHMIRRRETTLFQGAKQLEGRFRWCLTGTPIQNHLEDFGALLAFIRASELEHKAAFRKHIVVPFSEDVKTAHQNFVLLLDCFCLRRPQELLHLPDIFERYHYVDLSDSERRQYDETMVRMTRLIKERVGRKSGRHNTFGIFQAQLQLRLVCNHGTFQKVFDGDARHDRTAEKEDILYSLGSNAESSCSRCGIPVPVFELVDGSLEGWQCGHKLCQECISASRDSPGPNTDVFLTRCPICAVRVGRAGDPQHRQYSRDSAPSAESHLNETGTSSKINAFLEDLKQVPPDSKR